MDTRLLRLWSNFRPSWVVRPLILLVLFAVLLLKPQRAQGAQDAFASGVLSWESQARLMSGRITFVFPEDISGIAVGEHSDQFWLLPNRDLVETLQLNFLNREQREFRAGASEIEWPINDSGLGALRVTRVESAAIANRCPLRSADFFEQSNKFKFKPVDFELDKNERVLTVRTDRSLRSAGEKVRASGCRFVRVGFVFHPRVGSGNFALHSDGSASFSGPIYPVWKDRPLATQLRIESTNRDLTAHCTGCRSYEGLTQAVEFFGLPPPLHFNLKDEHQSVSFVNFDLDPTNENSSKEKKLGEIQETIQTLKRIAEPALQTFSNKNKKQWELGIAQALTIEQLVLEQSNEIQLHASFAKVAPLLDKFHRAALFRGVARSFSRFLLSDETQTQTWRDLRRRETLARILAEIWLRDAYPRLSFLKELSDRLDFVPFFRAVQQGSAFVNNAVFVGSEETGNRLDYGILDDFLAPMKGDEILSRMDACVGEDARKSIRENALKVAMGQISAHEFARTLERMTPIPKCSVPMEVGVIPDWTFRENIEIRETEKKSLQMVRKVVSSSQTAQFIFPDALVSRDPLQVLLTSSHSPSEIKIIKTNDAKDTTVELANSSYSARVLTPHRAVSSERLEFPRPVRTVLQALALNYDSRRADITLRSQIQTTQMGDEWGRSLTLGLRREYQRNYFDLQAYSAIPSIFGDARSAIALASTTQLVEAPPSFISASYSLDQGTGSSLYPDGVGLRLWLRRPLTLTAIQEKMLDPEQEWLLTAAVPLAPRLTWMQSLNYGRSETAIDAGLRSVPGWPVGSFTSLEYIAIRSEIRQIITQNLNASIARSVLFQHAALYAAHVVAFDDIQAARQGSVDARSAQSILAGVRFIGALLGAKDQALSFEIARALSVPPRNSFGMTVGKSLN